MKFDRKEQILIEAYASHIKTKNPCRTCPINNRSICCGCDEQCEYEHSDIYIKYHETFTGNIRKIADVIVNQLVETATLREKCDKMKIDLDNSEDKLAAMFTEFFDEV